MDMEQEQYFEKMFDAIGKRLDKIEEMLSSSIERTEERSSKCRSELFSKIDEHKKDADTKIITAKEQAQTYVHNAVQPVADDVKKLLEFKAQATTIGKIGAGVGLAMLAGIISLLVKIYGG